MKANDPCTSRETGLPYILKPLRIEGSGEGRRKRSAFTLVEILVVIAILGILMAMMVPAAGLILKRAKKARARMDSGVVVSALMDYRMEYNRWPPLLEVAPNVYQTDQEWMDVMVPNTNQPRTVANFNQVIFFEPGGGAIATNGLYVGAFVDPWGTPYRYMVDNTGAGEIQNPDPDPDSGEPAVIRAQVIAWSVGEDLELNGMQAEDWDDNLKSWE